TLPIAQYPEIAPPTVEVTATYPGADAVVVADSVAAPIEQQVNGVENMLYMSSLNGNDGKMTLLITFKLGTNLDIAQVLVQNRVNLALPKLPEAVKQQGVNVKKKSPNITLCVNLVSALDKKTGEPIHNQLDLSNYAAINVKDQIARLPGVGDVFMLGEREYSMRIWLDPDKLRSLDMNPEEVVEAVKDQNQQVASGQIGQAPGAKGQAYQFPIHTKGRLVTADEFDNIIVKTSKDGRKTLLKEVAEVELGAKNYDISITLNGQPSVTLAVYQLPGSNALATAEGIRKKMQELGELFPEGMSYRIDFDTTQFVETSIETVKHTLIEAIVLVFI